MFLMTLILISALAANPHSASPQGRSVDVSWDFEAPDMPYVPSFNESGRRVVPIVPPAVPCGQPLELTRIHAFQFMRGSSSGRDRNPVKLLSAGLVLTIKRPADAAVPPLAFVIDGGEADWASHDEFCLPRLSTEQWNELPPETSWVFQQKGLTLPKFWRQVTIKCE